LLSRSAINSESLSGEDERSGDSGDDLGGVSSRAASTHRTRFEDLMKQRIGIRNNQVKKKSVVLLVVSGLLIAVGFKVSIASQQAQLR
jgi:hypothetical protein